MNKLFRCVYYLLIVLSLGFSDNLLASFSMKEIPYLPIFKLEADSIHYPKGDKTALYPFYNKLDSLTSGNKKNVTILHIGGSHIQAGILSEQMRQNFGMDFPLANRGMIFPFRVAKTNGPPNYKITYTGTWNIAKNIEKTPQYTLGLTGMCVGTKDTTASITIKLPGDSAIPFSEIYVLANNDALLEPLIGVNDSLYTGSYDTEKRAYFYQLDAPCDSFTLFLRPIEKPLGNADFELRGFFVDNKYSGISYVDIGVNGASVPSYLRCSLFEQDLAFVKPDLCILSVGINDASGTDFNVDYFQNNYKELIRRIHNVVPDCVILFTTNNDSYRRVQRRYYNNRNGLLAQQAFMSLAQYHNAGVWDLFEFMGGLGSMRQWEQYGLSRRDKIHFTPQGYRLIGDLVYNALICDYLEYLNNKE